MGKKAREKTTERTPEDGRGREGERKERDRGRERGGETGLNLAVISNIHSL